MEHCSIHDPGLFGIFNPTLRAEDVGVKAVYCLITVYDPWIAADDSSRWDCLVTDNMLIGANDTLEIESEGGMETKCFLSNLLTQIMNYKSWKGN